MVKEFSSIEELRSIRSEKSRLSEREYELSYPMLEDMDLIPDIYEWFKEFLENRPLPPNINSVLQRKKFLFIILFLYSPSTLAGGRITNGLREELSKLFPNVSPCVISNNISDVYFIYNQYKETRKEIEEIYTEIINKLKKRI